MPLSINDSTCALYNLMSSGVEKYRRALNIAFKRQPASVAIFFAPLFIRSCGSKTTPSSRKSFPIASRRRRRMNSSLPGSNTTRFAAPQRCKLVWHSVSLASACSQDVFLGRLSQQLKSSAKTVSTKPSSRTEKRASA